STPRTRTDLLATRIGVPCARSSMSKALAASAGALRAPTGASRFAVAAVSAPQYPAGSSRQGADSGRVRVRGVGAVMPGSLHAADRCDGGGAQDRDETGDQEQPGEAAEV